MLPVIGVLRPWEDPTVVSIHRLAMHAPLPRARTKRLDGQWSLAVFDHPDLVPESSLSGPQTAPSVAVPGNWTLQDTGDLPHYTNVQMPFPGPPPALPERVTTGVYRRTMELPKSWSGQQVVFHVGGAESVHAVYVNGVFAGYGTDSRLPSEYDITALVSAGDNELAIVVIRYSAHSYVEDQDQWWMAGLHRSVWVEARPPVHVADIAVAGDADPATGHGTVSMHAAIGCSGVLPAGWQVRTTLTSPRGTAVGAPQVGVVPVEFARPYVFTGHVVEARWDVPRCQRWSAEEANLYTVTVELLDPKDRVVETHHQRVGLRRVEVAERQLLVNGQPVWIFGVNRHDHHPDRGKAVTVEDMRADLVAMRRHNITAVRTSHYPNDSAFYDLCDELGMYVVDEANVEAHAYNTSLCHDPRYRSTWLERGARMVQRDRNHPCVILWSLGNESGYGANHDALAGWIRRTDPSRPLHYEGAIFHGDGSRPAGPANWVDGGVHASDVVCPMYAPIADIQAYGTGGAGQRPLILCEYSHAMGNSNGSLADYWQAIESTPGLQGGFLWEWKDHGLRVRGPDGRPRLAYGGDFGDSPHDGNFVADGLMSADLEPHPAMREVAWVYRPVTVTLRGRRLLVTNRQSFVGLDGMIGRWELLVGGVPAARGVLRPGKVGPQQTVELPLPVSAPPGAADVVLSVRWFTKAATWFADAGHLLAWDQVELRPAAPRRPTRLAGDDGPSVVDELLTQPVQLAILRAPTDNDGFKLMPELSERIGVGGQALTRWRQAGVFDRDADTLVEHTVQRVVDVASITARHRVVVGEELADVARIGVRFAVPKRFSVIRWYGRGPHENYPDRAAAAMLGIWEGSPDELPYLVPQEFGLRCDTRWLELLDRRRGQTLRIDVLAPTSLHVSATRSSTESLVAAANAADVTAGDDLWVHLDVAHRGLGTASCGPDVLPAYRIAPGTYTWTYRLTLI